MLIGTKPLPYLIVQNSLKQKKTLWMGIVNATPDSFSDGGCNNSVDNALKRATSLLAHGADILDIGGVSTRPGGTLVSAEDEWNRVFSIVKAIKDRFCSSCLISIDTFRPSIAFKLASLGLVDIVNDVYAGLYKEDFVDYSTFDVASKFGLGLVVMHMQGSPQTMQLSPNYKNCLLEVSGFLQERANFAKQRGVKVVIIDPGIGFGKLLPDNLELMSQVGIQTLKNTGFPLLIGLSRKRFLKDFYSLEDEKFSDPKNRDSKSKEFEFQCIAYGSNIIRTHVMPTELGDI